jgi:hypothetical protein
MELGRSLNQGAASQDSEHYTGKHRSFGNVYHGVGFIPLGDRNRDRPECGVDYVVERDSVDKYTKLHGS